MLFQSQNGNWFSMYGVYYFQEGILNDKVLLMAWPELYSREGRPRVVVGER